MTKDAETVTWRPGDRPDLSGDSREQLEASLEYRYALTELWRTALERIATGEPDAATIARKALGLE